MKRLPFHQYEILADQFLLYLASLEAPAKTGMAWMKPITGFEKQLKEFKW